MKTTLKPVTKAHPCPVCGGEHKCSRGEDGLFMCGRTRGPVLGFVPLGEAKGDEQFAMYRREGDPLLDAGRNGAGAAPAARNGPAKGKKGGRTRPPPELNGVAEKCRAGLTQELRDELAAALGLPARALAALPMIGYDPAGPHREPETKKRIGPCWTFPEADAVGHVVGITCRYRDGSKRAWPGGSRGLSVPDGWPGDGPVFAAEGPSDVLAGAALGLCVVGRPSNTGGVEHLAALLRSLPADRTVVVVGEFDRKQNGDWPGRDGAVRTAARPAELLLRPVSWALPPAGAKDIRAWMMAQRLNHDRPEDWRGAGRTLAAAIEGAARKAGGETGATWGQPIPLSAGREVPPFPTWCLPQLLCSWAEAEAEATQTPPDLASALALSICGAALATKVRVVVRDGWTEPTNLFNVTALPPGDHKSAVFQDAMAPVFQFELEEAERRAPEIAEAASEHRMMEARLKIAEQKAAKAENAEERQQLRHEAKELARELAAHVVPEPPQMFCDDETAESLGRLIARQGGRMLQASAEGTAFEIVKGRYSESPNFDVYLKGHAGDPLRVGRVGRDKDIVDRPALSVALAVQPDLIQGLAEQAVLRGRGFLARFLYSLPVSRVGSRTIGPRPVPKAAAVAYRETVLRLWRLQGAVEDGKPAAHLLRFAPAADRRMQDFERWLEPQMAEGEELSLLAGWAQKLAGAVARIAGILHVVEAVAAGRPWQAFIEERTVGAAVALARDYFLPHAQAAFAVMGPTPRLRTPATSGRPSPTSRVSSVSAVSTGPRL